MAAIHPQLISQFLTKISAISAVSEKGLKLEGLINRLEDEMEKIDSFKNQLPISMLLINEVILNMKEELVRCKERKFEPVLEEFIPLKKSCDVEKHSEVVEQNDNRDKMDWMSSVQLWNTSDQIKQIDEEEDRRAIPSFKSLSVFPVQLKKKEDVDDAGLSLFTPGIVQNSVTELGSSNKSNCSRGVSSSSFDGESNQRSGLNQPQTSRKQRRCWSPELHRRFVNALQQLGGSQVATPKQIRELMQVDGLTNDEVKSHLQKYRLHTRRVPSAGSTATNQSHILLGGLFTGQDQFRESSKQSNSHSGSPQGPLISTRAGPDSAEDDESEDGKSESYSWKK